MGLEANSRLLVIGTTPEQLVDETFRSGGWSHVDIARSIPEALARLASCSYQGILFSPEMSRAECARNVLQGATILEGMADGVAVLDVNSTIVWCNSQLKTWSVTDQAVGKNFYSVFGGPEILGPEFCPFNTARSTGTTSVSTIRAANGQYYRVHASPLSSENEHSPLLVVTVRDVTADAAHQQKLQAIHQAGAQLAEITPEELFQMSVPDRINLLKSNILHFTQDLLKFDVVEIRLLDVNTNKLEPLLSVGLTQEASQRVLYARPQGNGVTGFVAATGKSYVCEDTTEDPLFLEGAAGAKSSLTVPLLFHEHVIGTFNVESPRPRAFSDSDLQFLELFSRHVAVALNTLELLVAEKASSVAESAEAIHSAIALPIDRILNDSVNIMERYIGHDPELSGLIQRILGNARDIKKVVQSVGQKMAPSVAIPQNQLQQERHQFRGLQVLVVDADEGVRSTAHTILERYGCVVETAHTGAEALRMVRTLAEGAAYDVIISDIRLEDMSGIEILTRLQEILDVVPLVLMTGYGYDPSHCMVRARQAGLPAYAILFKPFRLEQLLDTIEKVAYSSHAVNPS